MKAETFPKSCACGRVHSRDAWVALPNRKVWHVDETLTMELRDCTCGSTLAIEITLASVLLGWMGVAA